LEIPSAYLFTSSQRTIEYEKKVVKEIALGFTRLLYVTSEKLLLNESLKILCNRLYRNRKLQFVIDEAHCIFSFCHFRKLEKIRSIETNYPGSNIMALTTTLSWDNIVDLRSNLNISAQNFKLVRSENFLQPELYFLVLDRENSKSDLVKQPDDSILPVCNSSNSCNNCIRRNADCVEKKDARIDIVYMLRVLNVLSTKTLAELALADLVYCSLVKQSIWLERKSYLICSLVIKGTTEDADLLVNTNSWLYWK
ncbi:7163_t:CDS:2, partial [Scutellospora calospora]